MSQTTVPSPAVLPAPVRGPGVKHLLVVVVILAVTVTVTALTSKVDQALEPGIRLVDGRPYLPDALGEWRGGELQGLTLEERKMLPSDTEGARRVYRNALGQEVICSVVLSGRDVTSIHRPEVCLPGQGWMLENSSVVVLAVPAAPGGQLAVTKLDSKRTVGQDNKSAVPIRSIFAYWFIGKDRITPHHWERILWTAKDRVLHNKNHRWAYVLVFTLVPTDREGKPLPGAADESLRVVHSFIGRLYPQLATPNFVASP